MSNGEWIKHENQAKHRQKEEKGLKDDYLENKEEEKKTYKVRNIYKNNRYNIFWEGNFLYYIFSANVIEPVLPVTLNIYFFNSRIKIG